MTTQATGAEVISFGIVLIPVHGYSLVQTPQQVRFNLLSDLKQQHLAALEY